MRNLDFEKTFIKYSNVSMPGFENNIEFKNNIDKFLSQQISSVPEVFGQALSSVKNRTAFENFPNFNILFRNLFPYIKQSIDFFDIKSFNFQLKGAWVNKIFKGCKGANHTHSSDHCDLICIYYFSAPENSSKLVLTDCNINGITEDFISNNKKYYISVKTGDLVLHKPDVFHAVSEHKSDEPRICFVFELKFI